MTRPRTIAIYSMPLILTAVPFALGFLMGGIAIVLTVALIVAADVIAGRLDSGPKRPPRPSIPSATRAPRDPLDVLAQKYISGRLDLIDFVLAVDAYDPSLDSRRLMAALPAHERPSASCRDCEIFECYGGRSFVCTGGRECRRPSVRSRDALERHDPWEAHPLSRPDDFPAHSAEEMARAAIEAGMVTDGTGLFPL